MTALDGGTPCPQGRTDYEECFAPFRYCPVKGCGRVEGDGQLPTTAAHSTLPEEGARSADERYLDTQAHRGEGDALYLPGRDAQPHAATGAFVPASAPREEGALPDEVRTVARNAAVDAGIKERDEGGGSAPEPFVFLALVDAAAEVAYSAGLAAGEARATARIVADLRVTSGALDHEAERLRNGRNTAAADILDARRAVLWIAADRYERGEHLAD